MTWNIPKIFEGICLFSVMKKGLTHKNCTCRLIMHYVAPISNLLMKLEIIIDAGKCAYKR